MEKTVKSIQVSEQSGPDCVNQADRGSERKGESVSTSAPRQEILKSESDEKEEKEKREPLELLARSTWKKGKILPTKGGNKKGKERSPV